MVVVRAHLITTKAIGGICARCLEPVVVGVCDGLTVRVDPYPILRDIEIVAVIAGRQTYSLFAGTLVRRADQSPVSGPVLIQHVCGHVLRVPPPADPEPEPIAYVPPF